jgi:hypothetical protein
MSSGALDWLKAGNRAGKTAKQAEIVVSQLSKILFNRPAAWADSSRQGMAIADFGVNREAAVTD